MSELQGVILAAGRGTRMHPISPRFPKPILPIGNRPLVTLQAEAMRDVGITELTVVIGHLGHEIVRELGDGSDLGLRIRYAEQQETLGIAHAVGMLEEQIRGPFLLFLGDIYFEFMQPGSLSEMIEEFRAEEYNAVLAVKEEEAPEAVRKNFAVIEDDEGRVCRVIEKPRYAESRIKGCGIYLFDLHIFDAIRRTPRTAQRDEYEITDSIQILIDYGRDVRARRILSEDRNLSVPADLLESNLLAVRRSGAESILGVDVKLHPGARVLRSVIGDGAVVKGPISITDSLVFAGAEVPDSKDIHRSIVTPQTHIRC
ncbi:MAG: sugar phosphate nucleotidyltransferase [Planctomycetota bacterium]|nr:sugar phosphate nucleotidyltransferase [Planctomycetota bacterium]